MFISCRREYFLLQNWFFLVGAAHNVIEVWRFICIKMTQLHIKQACESPFKVSKLFDFQSKLCCYWEMVGTDLLLWHPQQCGIGILSLELSEGMSTFPMRKQTKHWCSCSKWNRKILMMKRKSKALPMWAEFCINSLKMGVWKSILWIGGQSQAQCVNNVSFTACSRRKTLSLSLFVTTVFISISFFFF